MRRSILIPVAVAALALPVALVAKPAHPDAHATPAPAPSASPSMTPEQQRAALNLEQARKAQQQVDENVAREINNREAAKNAAARQREFEEASRRYETSKTQYEAQVAKYNADVEKWKADVAACQAGQTARCGKPQ